MNRLVCALVVMAAGGAAFADDYLGVEITGIRQRYPWNGKVDIDFTVASTNPDRPVILTFSAVDGTVTPATNLVAQSFDGASTNTFAVMPGSHRTTWDTDADVPKSVIDRVSFRISATTDYPETDDRKYMVVDLRKGVSASAEDTYPVAYLPAMPLGLAIGDDRTKTDYLVLRRIPATTSDEWLQLSGGNDYFMMGPTADDTLSGNKDNATYKVRISKAFYLGIYECTQRQFELVKGIRPSFFSNEVAYATRPVENLKANIDVGHRNSRETDGTPFVKLLCTRTGLYFSLPTEAEWEYAARAGTTTVWNNGGSFTDNGYGDENMKILGRYAYNGGNQADSGTGLEDASKGTAAVGSYLPNAWGLYDMHGNVCEMCRDYWKSSITEHWAAEAYDEETGIWTDPGFLNYDNVDHQVRRGGNYNSPAKDNLTTERAAYLGYGDDARRPWTGFRIACYPED
ncbi:MAG: formylglycine-generating enzyme family protein [Kiritimatiellia bacterium]